MTVLILERSRIALIAEGLLAAARERRVDDLFARLAISRRDGDAVRDLLDRRGELAQLIDAFLEAAESPRDHMRFLAAQAMDHFADQRCEPVLRRLLRDPVPRVRWAALHSLQCEACKLVPLSHGEDMLVALIAMALGDPSVKVRRVATYELGHVCADPRARAALQRIVAEVTDQAVLREARRALARRDTSVA
jgi:HEAT repeat protein